MRYYVYLRRNAKFADDENSSRYSWATAKLQDSGTADEQTVGAIDCDAQDRARRRQLKIGPLRPAAAQPDPRTISAAISDQPTTNNATADSRLRPRPVLLPGESLRVDAGPLASSLPGRGKYDVKYDVIHKTGSTQCYIATPPALDRATATSSMHRKFSKV